jgi:hypothetical protein
MNSYDFSHESHADRRDERPVALAPEADMANSGIADELDAAFAENCGADARQSRHWPADETHARAAVGK